jgi:hypothetical protein
LKSGVVGNIAYGSARLNTCADNSQNKRVLTTLPVETENAHALVQDKTTSCRGLSGGPDSGGLRSSINSEEETINKKEDHT